MWGWPIVISLSFIYWTRSKVKRERNQWTGKMNEVCMFRCLREQVTCLFSQKLWECSLRLFYSEKRFAMIEFRKWMTWLAKGYLQGQESLEFNAGFFRFPGTWQLSEEHHATAESWAGPPDTPIVFTKGRSRDLFHGQTSSLPSATPWLII